MNDIFGIVWLLLLLLISITKQFGYYCGVRGLIFYLETEHNDVLDNNKIKKITDNAVRKVIHDFFIQN